MSMQVGEQGGLKSDMNVTPLIDVLLVLLVIFMVVAPMALGARYAFTQRDLIGAISADGEASLTTPDIEEKADHRPAALKGALVVFVAEGDVEATVDFSTLNESGIERSTDGTASRSTKWNCIAARTSWGRS